MLKLTILATLVALVAGHGRVLVPPGRASAWRAGFPTPPNYDDDGLNCGGFAQQWEANDGRCGLCGDAYDISEPRPHELGGKYGLGIIVGNYKTGSVFTATVDLTVSHRGYWIFNLCPDPLETKQACFDDHPVELEDGGIKYYPSEGSRIYEVKYKLPADVSCEHCVLQWRYIAGNNWGVCTNGTQGLGCGNQEQFRACSDISIGATGRNAFQGYDGMPYPLYFYLTNGYYEKRVEYGAEDNKIEQD